MPYIRDRELRLTVRTKDHLPAHVHVLWPGGNVDIVVLLGQRRLVTIRSVEGPARRPDFQRALNAVAAHFDDLMTLWENVHGNR